MASLKDMRVRIAATKATQKITKAMQMVAASKLRRAQAAAEAARPYAERMEQGAGLDRLGGGRQRFGAETAGRHRRRQGASAGRLHRASAACAAPSTRRSCGWRARRSNALTNEGKEVKILCVGRKGADQLRRLYGKQIIETIELRGVRTIGFEQAEMIAEKIIALFDEGAFDVCTLFFSRFRSVIAQIPTAQQIIPPVFEKPPRPAPPLPTNTSRRRTKSSPSCCRAILPVQVFRALLENAASEQGARMSAMDNATRNAGEMIRKQTLTYNRTRQAMITKELIEIISGAEAL